MRYLILSLLAATAVYAEEPITAERRQQILQQFEEQKKGLDAELEKNPDNADWRTRRGDVRLFLGDAKGAVEDFEKEIALDPTRNTPHWRLGIAYHFAGQWEKSAAQFAKYHAYDDRDRENGIWHFLANARIHGLEAARKSMLEYTRFDREPFPDLYDMLAGKKTGAEVLAAAEKKGLKDNALVMFFAHYYVGLNEQLLGNTAAANEHLATAVKLAQQTGARGGPGYMGQVARLHYDARNKPIAAPAKGK
jgi:lipoprotein NlpI